MVNLRLEQVDCCGRKIIFLNCSGLGLIFHTYPYILCVLLLLLRQIKQNLSKNTLRSLLNINADDTPQCMGVQPNILITTAWQLISPLT